MTSQQIIINYSITLFTCKIQRAIIIYIFTLASLEEEKSIFKQIYIINNTQKQITYQYIFLFTRLSILIRLNTTFTSKSIKLYIIKSLNILKDINLCINALKFINKQLIKNENLRNYKMLHKNPRDHNSRIYNRLSSNEIIIA